MSALIIAVGLGLGAWLCYRLMRWARSGARGAHVLGSVLTEVTQSAVVREAKEGKKRSEADGGDPENESSGRKAKDKRKAAKK
jgi:hypothetical protein